jgi:proline dehydrogenase
MANMYNKDKAIIMNGYQAYRLRTRYWLRMEIERCRLLGINVCVKLVRGAYMNEEREIAEEKGIESPIWGTIEETHKSYDDCLEYVTKDLREGERFLMGSHNQESIDIGI